MEQLFSDVMKHYRAGELDEAGRVAALIYGQMLFDIKKQQSQDVERKRQEDVERKRQEEEEKQRQEKERYQDFLPGTQNYKTTAPDSGEGGNQEGGNQGGAE